MPLARVGRIEAPSLQGAHGHFAARALIVWVASLMEALQQPDEPPQKRQRTDAEVRCGRVGCGTAAAVPEVPLFPPPLALQAPSRADDEVKESAGATPLRTASGAEVRAPRLPTLAPAATESHHSSPWHNSPCCCHPVPPSRCPTSKM